MPLSRFHRLGALLAGHDALWRPAPFHVPRPAWCEHHLDLAGHVLELPDAALAALAADDAALIGLVARFIPALAELAPLIELPRARVPTLAADPRLALHVPGRKQGQIEAFAAAIGPAAAPVLEWCAGKGHLGRLLAGRWGMPVASLDLDAGLCAAGAALARAAAVAQEFITADALAPEAGACLAGRHAVALHACGDLHLALLHAAAAAAIPALDFAPCCYYRTASPRYRPLTPDAGLALTRDELHLAVTGTATAGARELRQRDRAMAWKLGFMEWRHERAGIPRAVPFKPVPAAWLALGWPEWLARLARREGLDEPAGAALDRYERAGWARQREVLRLDLVRLAFRRPLEVWLALDRLLYLERAGYAARLSTFCPPALTPRNLLISARR